MAVREGFEPSVAVMTADLRRVRDAAKMRSALETPKTASGEVRIDASRFDTNHALFFDRFKIKPGPSFFELHFGFYGFARELQDGLIVIVSRLAVEAQKESLLQYLKRIGPLPEPTELLPCTLRGEVDVVIADIIGASQHRSAVAEITFHAFSWKTIVDKVRETSTEPILATCTALLRCDPDLQKRWLLSLYEEEVPDDSKAS